MGRRRETVHLLGWVLVGALLRGLRVLTRWDELTLAYAAYDAPVVEALAEGRLLDAVGTWIGLHPPLYAVLHGLSEVLLPVPLLWLAGSALLSLGAVAVVGRHAGPLAAAVLATSPVVLADAAEVNNYPLATLAVALLLATARGPWWALAAAATLACWSHVLAAAGAGAVVAWRLLRGGDAGPDRLRLAAAAALGALPVVIGAALRAGGGEAFIQPAWEVGPWLSQVVALLGPVGVGLALVAAAGLRGPALVAWTSVAALLAVALATGAAAPHQRPYLGLLAPAAAVGVGLAVRRLPGRWGGVLALGVALACGIRGADQAGAELDRLRAIQADLQRTRALDVALARAAPGDTLWVVVPALQPDDDKSATGPLMWRLPPWQPMPVARPVPFEYTDYRYGQPREVDGVVVHTSTELDEQALDHVARAVLPPAGDGRVLIVLADHGPAAGLQERVERALRPYQRTALTVGEDVGLGHDRLYVLSGLLPPAGAPAGDAAGEVP